VVLARLPGALYPRESSQIRRSTDACGSEAGSRYWHSRFSMATISRENMGEASGLTNLLRNLGGSVGISAITALVARGTQTRQALLVGHLNPYNPVFNDHIAKVQSALAPQVGSVAAHDQAYGLTYQTLQQQAALGAYVDQFRLLVIVCLLCIPLVFLFKKPARRPAGTDLAAAH
jgi:DHA2 family multidrug resistance protein